MIFQHGYIDINCVGRFTCSCMEWAIQVGNSQVTYSEKGPLIQPDAQTQDILWEGFSHSLQAAAIEHKKLWEPKVAKLKGVCSSNASLTYQLWLKDIQMYMLEYWLSQHEAIQLMKDYTLMHKPLILPHEDRTEPCSAGEPYIKGNVQWCQWDA